jgi:hypothetical protein
MAIAGAVKFITNPGVRENGHQMQILLPEEAVPMMGQVLEQRKQLHRPLAAYEESARSVETALRLLNTSCVRTIIRCAPVRESSGRCGC